MKKVQNKIKTLVELQHPRIIMKYGIISISKHYIRQPEEDLKSFFLANVFLLNVDQFNILFLFFPPFRGLY